MGPVQWPAWGGRGLGREGPGEGGAILKGGWDYGAGADQGLGGVLLLLTQNCWYSLVETKRGVLVVSCW